MKRWAYLVHVLKGETKTGAEAAVLSQFGAQGWELVSVTTWGDQIVYYFKRSSGVDPFYPSGIR